ncbi:hypothetical protein Ahy_A09g045299 [Arachis hypogaea]|uniref:Uncharacterized protein n=1 Tax=Arachis hypogaea TaxID=3818 RepID=A0A445BM13_ARAHY|nr:hypothetical protein Ahy_A09g045299 [Arachis hypogaea]
MMEDSNFTIDIHHGGKFHDLGNELGYLGGKVLEDMHYELNEWSLQEIKQVDLKNTPGHGYKLATPQLMQLKAVKPPRKKGKVVLGTPCKLSVILEKPLKIAKPKDTAKSCQNDASSPTSNGATSNSKLCSRGRRTLTVPKEPKFHSLHVPRSCTIRNPT